MIIAFYSFVDAIFNLVEWRREKKLLLTGTETKGTIIDAHTYPDIEELNSGQYCFTAEFKAADNIAYHARSRFASRSPHKFLNREVAIIYDPQNPQHSRFKTDISIMREIIIKISMLAIGLGLILFALLWNWT